MKQPKKNTNKTAQATALEKDSSLQWIKKLKWILFGAAFIIFINSLGNNYNMDDELVTRNHKLTSQGLSGLSEIFTSPYYSDDMGYSYGYRPIVHLSFALEHDLFGESPGVGHFINVLLFALSGIYLFRLFNLLFGEKNYLYSFLACMLFIIHPIHTEVVDSLKNRDEILAVLFSLISSIQLIKFVTNKSFSNLFWTVVTFLLAILSKKSMYPMIIIVPTAIALVKTVPFKHLILATSILAIPAAIFGSELQLQRGLLLGITPLITLSCVYFFLSPANKINASSLKSFIWLVPSFLIALVIYYFYTTFNIYSFLFFIPLFFWVFKTNLNKGIWVGSIALLIVSIIDVNQWLFLFTIILSFGFAAFDWKINANKQIGLLILSVSALIIGSVLRKEIWLLIITLNFVLLLWILFNKPKWSLFYALATLVIIIVVGYFVDEQDALDISRYSYGVVTVIMSLIWINYQKTGNIKTIRQLPFIGISILIACVTSHAYIDKLQNDKIQPTQTIEQPVKSTNQADELMADIYRTNKNDGKNIFKEGRMLEYVENPLVVPHSSEETIATGFYTLGKYVQLLVFPQNLSFYYGYATIDIQKLSSIPVIISLVIHLLLLFLILFYLTKNPWISIGFGWYLSSILLFSNWLELVAGVVGERLVYLPSIGFFIGIIGLIKEFKLIERYRKPTLIGLTFVAIALSGRTMIRNLDWKDTYTLMTHDIKHLSNSAQANNLVAGSLMGASLDAETDFTQEERIQMQREAVKHFDRALEIYPHFFNAAFDKGRAAKILNDTTKVIEAFEQAVKIGNKNFLFPYYELQDIYFQKRDLKNYLSINKKLIVLDSLNPKIYSHLANSYYQLKEIDSAELVLQNAVKKFPDNSEISLNLKEIQAAKLRQ